MQACVKRIHIDVSALPILDSFYPKIVPIVKKRIEDRYGTVCTAENVPLPAVIRTVSLSGGVCISVRAAVFPWQGRNIRQRHWLKNCLPTGMYLPCPAAG